MAPGKVYRSILLTVYKVENNIGIFFSYLAPFLSNLSQLKAVRNDILGKFCFRQYSSFFKQGYIFWPSPPFEKIIKTNGGKG